MKIMQNLLSALLRSEMNSGPCKTTKENVMTPHHRNLTLRKVRLWAPALLGVLVVLVFMVPAYAMGNSHANGGGTTIEVGEKSTFVFNAVEQPDGSVTGHLVYQFRAFDFGIIMDIDCLAISGSGNQARLSGVVTHLIGEVPPEFSFIFVGAEAEFAVTDNGQGKNAPADLVSDVLFGSGVSCEDGGGEPYLPISGNIQVSQ
jgi:hypothetical protein